jgi:NAD(P)-dependent dehydrogenase (short-subunit alcohol dehydrogenase family)
VTGSTSGIGKATASALAQLGATVIVTGRTWLHNLFATLVTEAGYRDAGKLTAQLVILYDGANISAQLDHNPAAAAAARDAAAGLLSTAAA